MAHVHNSSQVCGRPLTRPDRLVVAITGASGAPYARMLLDELTRVEELELHLIVSPSALIVMKEELGITFPGGRFDPERYLGRAIESGRIVQHSDSDVAAAPASGSFRHRGMVICPCSMKTLGTIASGTGSNLVSRAADACLKERRRLVLVPRETPLNLIHLRNMTAVTEAGAVVLPAMPGFYHRPETIDDLLRHLVLKICDVLDVDTTIPFRWKDADADHRDRSGDSSHDR